MILHFLLQLIDLIMAFPCHTVFGKTLRSSAIKKDYLESSPLLLIEGVTYHICGKLPDASL